MSDVRAALDWVAVCRDAIGRGDNWRQSSDIFVRNLPVHERVGPYLFASWLDRLQHQGNDPAVMLDQLEVCLTILSIAGAEPEPQ